MPKERKNTFAALYETSKKQVILLPSKSVQHVVPADNARVGLVETKLAIIPGAGEATAGSFRSFL